MAIKATTKVAVALLAISAVSANGVEAKKGGKKDASKTIPRAVASDVKYIECETCELLVNAAVKEYKTQYAEVGSKKLRETDVIEKMEKMCDVASKEGDWIITKDLQEKGSKLRLVDMGAENYGECRTECKTIVKACEKILGPRDTDVGEYLFVSDGDVDAKAFRKWLCEEETTSCAKAPPPLPKDRPKGEAFKKRDKKDVEMERLMAGMKGMPGMGGAQMFSRDQMMGGFGGGDDDDDDDENPYGKFDPSSLGGGDDSLKGRVTEKLGDIKSAATSTAKNAWNKAKSLFSKTAEDAVEDVEFPEEELAKEEL
ncbi:unnamed product [Ostreococcus tauri]|uniref:Unnamed product n=1 Tax=Ostreococcus tauri TaxID=70448 RepID=Q01FF7_OSTTA|nr:unnamed product [Ostreococcus tauri]CAL50537.1 unnamed product [Ostreococcus tauri]|eukprot:XP_003074687.1 unnamed product [Ostreococcus tauri]